MEKKKLNVPKAILSLALCLALIFTSLPLVIARAEEGDYYDPVPTFPNAGIAATQNENMPVAALGSEDGSVTVQFPAAEVHNGEPGKPPQGKTVKYYLIEFSDLGVTAEAHTNTPLLTKLLDPDDLEVVQWEAAGTPHAGWPATYAFTLSKEEIVAALAEAHGADPAPAGLDPEHTYNVRVTAIDSDNWYSLPMDVVVSDTPLFIYDETAFAPMSTSDKAMLPILRFEGGGAGMLERGDAPTHGSPTPLVGVSESDRECRRENTGNNNESFLQLRGVSDQVGARNTAGTKDTNGYRLRIRGRNASPQSFDLNFSCECWDCGGAEEIWYWLDLRQVELKGLSFRIGYNEKKWHTNGKITDLSNYKYGSPVFSTAGCAHNTYEDEAQPYIYLQQADNSWKKVPLTNGKIDLGHYTGYVRVPTCFLCSETDSRIEVENTAWNSTAPIPNDPVVVDPAGTPFGEAMLIQQSSGGKRMLAIGKDAPDDYGNYTGGHVKATWNAAAGEVDNRENGLKACHDVYSAGLAYDRIGESGDKALDSVDKTFFLDNVLAYAPNGFNDSLNVSQGQPVSDFYSQENEIARAIFNQADELIELPTAGCFREVKYIESMIAAYAKAYDYNEPVSNAFLQYKDASGNLLDTDGLIQKSIDLHMEREWKKFTDAYELCRGTQPPTYLDPTRPGTNSEANAPVVEYLAAQLALLPDPSSVYYVTPEQKAKLKAIYQIYTTLNRGQLEYLGMDNENKIIDYLEKVTLSAVSEDAVVVGSGLAEAPFIPFNTFENDALGKRTYQLENDPEFMVEKRHCTLPSNKPLSYWGVHRNYLYRKGLVSFSSSEFRDTNGHNNIEGTATQFAQYGDNIKYGFQATGPGGDGSGGLRFDPSHAQITDRGFLGTQGLTMTVGAQYFDSHDGGQGDYNTLSVTRERAGGSAEIVDPANMSELANQAQALRAVNGGNSNMHDEKLGEMWIHRKSDNDRYMDPEKIKLPLSIAMYVDFSEIRDFFFDMSITTVVEHKESEHGDDPAGLGWVNSQVGVDKFGLDVVGTKLEGFLSSEGLKGYVWMLNGETGEFERTQVDTTNPYTINSGDMKYTKSDGSFVTLNGYKGWIMIPLYSFLRLTGTSWASQPPFLGITPPPLLQAGAVGEHLDGHFDTLNNIWRVDVNVAPQNAAAAAAMDGKSFTIDNIGFTYDPTAYATMLAARKHPDESFDHYFPAKSTSVEQFEKAVSEINPYDDKTTFEEAVAAAQTLYSKIHTETQRGFAAEAKARLDIYQGYVTNPDTKPPAANLTDLKNSVNALPDGLRSAVIPELTSLVSYDGATGQPQVNYAVFGLTAENFEIYKNTVNGLWTSYLHLTTEENASFETSLEFTSLKNARAAIDRLAYLTNQVNKVVELQNDLIRVYLPAGEPPEGVSGGLGFVDPSGSPDEYFAQAIQERAEIQNIYDKYIALDYDGKLILKDGNTPQKFEEIPDSLAKLLQNTRDDVMDSSDNPVEGGVIVRKAEYDVFKTEVLGMIAAGNYDIKAGGNAAEWQRMKDKVVEFENYVDYLYFEWDMYEPIRDILRAFPAVKMAESERELEFTDTKKFGEASFSMSYLSVFPTDPSQPTAPASYAGYQDKVTINFRVSFNENGMQPAVGTVAVPAGGSLDPMPYTLTDADDASIVNGDIITVEKDAEDNDLKNNTLAESISLLSLKMEITGDPLNYVCTDTVTLTPVYKVGDEWKDYLNPDGTPKSSKVRLTYIPAEFYKVCFTSDTTINWGDTSPHDVGYTVNSHLQLGNTGPPPTTNSKITVEIDASELTLINTDKGTIYRMPYTVANDAFDEKTYEGKLINYSHTANISIAESAWRSVPIGVYTETLIYKVTYTASKPS